MHRQRTGPRRRLAVHGAAACAAIALCAACAGGAAVPCFDPPSILLDTRVLALRAEPPEALYDLSRGLLPSVRLQALVASPQGEIDDVPVEARLCLAFGDQECRDQPSAAAGQMRDVPQGLLLAPGADLLRAALLADPLQGYAGVRILATFKLLRSPPIEGRKLLLFSPDAPGFIPNHNLEVADLAVAYPRQPLALLLGERLELVVGQSVSLRPILAPGPGGTDAIEEYDIVGLNGRPAHVREHISYSFFAGSRHGFFGPTRNSQPGLQLSVWEDAVSEADEPEPGQAQPTRGLIDFNMNQVADSQQFEIGSLWVVARDGRGGVGWKKFPFRAEEQRLDCRACSKGCVLLRFECPGDIPETNRNPCDF